MCVFRGGGKSGSGHGVSFMVCIRSCVVLCVKSSKGVREGLCVA